MVWVSGGEVNSPNPDALSKGATLVKRDATGDRMSSLAKIVWYYHTHLATILNGSFIANLNRQSNDCV